MRIPIYYRNYFSYVRHTRKKLAFQSQVVVAGFLGKKKKSLVCDVKVVYGELSIYIIVVTIYCVPIRFEEPC